MVPAMKTSTTAEVSPREPSIEAAVAPSLPRWLKALAEPRRLLLLEMLIEGVQCNCDLGEALGMAPNLVSHHLRVLREAGLVHAEHDPLDARWVYYSIDPGALRELIDALNRFLDPERVQPRRATCGPKIAPRIAGPDEPTTFLEVETS
jgi:ArsR family transcriptional regulator